MIGYLMTATDPSEELVRTCGDLLRTVRSLTRAQDADWLGLDMGLGQLRTLVVLHRYGTQTVGGVADRMKVSNASASLLIDKLVRRRLVVRSTDPEDRRRMRVALSDKGESLMDRLRHANHDSLDTWLRRLSQEDLLALQKGLGSLAAVIESDIEEE